MYRGRIGRRLIQAMDNHYSMLGVNRMSHNGERWARQLITVLWKTTLELWSKRNEIIYERDKGMKENLTKEKLHTRIQRCYDLKAILTAKERQQWFTNSINEQLQQDAKYLEAWTRTVERIIRITKQEQNKRQPGSRIMERFLNIIHYNVARARRPTNNPRRLPQDMNPD
jgi:hypothetical protein